MRPHLKVLAMHPDTQLIDVDAKCSVCGKIEDFELPIVDWFRWQKGELIQRCFPDMDIARREILISGICGVCFDNLFKED